KLREFLGLAPAENSLYSFADFSGKIDALVDEANRALKGKADERSEFDKHVLELAAHAELYRKYARFETPHKIFRIENDQGLSLLGLERREYLRYGFDEFVPRIGPLIREATRVDQLPEKDRSVYDAKVLELANHIKLYVDLAQREGDRAKGDLLKMVPPAKAG